MSRTSLHPSLYEPSSETPLLNGTTCSACGLVVFPPVSLGCTKCGAAPEQLKATPLAAAGTLHSVATIHIHTGKDIEAPFTVAEVKLDSGPLIRALMIKPASAGDIGKRVAGQWFVESTSEDGAQNVEPRFVITEEEAV